MRLDCAEVSAYAQRPVRELRTWQAIDPKVSRMFLLPQRLVPSYSEVCQCGVSILVCMSGLVGASYLWIINGSMLLLLAGWSVHRPRYEQIAASAVAPAIRLVAAVGAKLGRDSLLLALVFLLGELIRWTLSAEVNQATLMNVVD